MNNAPTVAVDPSGLDEEFSWQAYVPVYYQGGWGPGKYNRKVGVAIFDLKFTVTDKGTVTGVAGLNKTFSYERIERYAFSYRRIWFDGRYGPQMEAKNTLGDTIEKGGTKSRLVLLQVGANIEKDTIFAGTDATIKLGKKGIPVFAGTDFSGAEEGIGWQAWISITPTKTKKNGPYDNYQIKIYHGPQVDKTKGTGLHIGNVIFGFQNATFEEETGAWELPGKKGDGHFEMLKQP